MPDLRTDLRTDVRKEETMGEKLVMTLAKALAYKNRLIEKIRECDNKIMRYNRVLKEPGADSGSNRPYNIYELLERRDELTAHLVDLKAAITEANQQSTIDGTGPSAQELIFAMAELKSKIVILQSLDCDSGIEMPMLRGEENPLRWDSAIDEKDRDIILEELRSDVDGIQETLAVFNVEKTIAVASL